MTATKKEKIPVMKVEKNETATEDLGENANAEEKEIHTMPPPEKQMSDKEIRAEHVKRCNNEIAAILEKYRCELTAHIIVSDRGNFPQVVTRALPLDNEES